MKAVKVGVESFDEEVLQDANRFTVKKDEQLSKIRQLEKNNIQSHLCLLLISKDNLKTINETIKYAKKLTALIHSLVFGLLSRDQFMKNLKKKLL